MGIGRFAFTPLLPMMLADGVVDLHAASWLATANYIGYLTGALLCAFEPAIRARLPCLPRVADPTMIHAGLVATGLLTVAMALPAPALWPTLRFCAGVASAFVLVYTSGWCLAALARLNAPAVGGAMYAGPGAGILISGLLVGALVAAGARASSAWLICGALAFALSAAVWRIFLAPGLVASAPTDAATALATSAARLPDRVQIGWLALAYGLAGFGYIVTATFLPVIARQALPDSRWLDLFWPIFGSGVVTGALLATRLRGTGDRRRLLSIAYLMQAAAIALGVWLPTATGFALGSFVLGLPFTAITFFALQEARRLRPTRAPSTIGLLTATYGIGQIVGPPMVAALLQRSRSVSDGFTLALEIAAGGLVVGAAIYEGIRRRWPIPRPA